MGIEEDLKSIFFEEAREHVASLEGDLIQLEYAADSGDKVDADLVNRIFRSAHTIKGGAGSVGFTDLSGFTHTLENVLDRVREQSLGVTNDLISVLLQSVDCIARLLDAAMDAGDPPSEQELANIIEHLNGYLGGAVDAAAAAAEAAARAAANQLDRDTIRSYHIDFKFSRAFFESGTDPLMLLSELSELGYLAKNTANTDDLPALDEMDPHQLYLSWQLELTGNITPADLDGVFIFVVEDNPITYREIVEGDPMPQAAPQSPRDTGRNADSAPTSASAMEADEETKDNASTKARMSSVRVDTDRLDRLVNLVGELVIGQARVAQEVLATNPDTDVVTAVELLDRITRDLQDEAMGMRMLPIGPTFVQFQRVVRDLALSQGKEVALEISGQETELDKSIIEKIGDPLKHMVRNAVDHGLESPAERQQAGKPKKGKLRLAAYHAEGNIVIEITDDGKGLNADAISAKAIREGLIPPDHSLTKDQIHYLIFHPGLSTAAKVTDVSGRGVGMDVVKRNIEDLRGRIDIQTKMGKGSTFKITLPLTLAIIEGMALAVGEEVFLIPLLSIVESIRPKKHEVETVAGKGEMVVVRGEALPLVRLHEELGVFLERKCPSEALVIIVESGGKRYCLLVDDILGQQQVVIKTMEQNYKKVEGVAGASILADGKVAMILDITALLHKAYEHHEGAAV